MSATDGHCKIPCLSGAIDETIEEYGKASKNGSRCPLEHNPIGWHRLMLSSLWLSMISGQTPLAFVARKNRFPLFRIML
jgi:hypothetical protein